jgi:hypothetical protein
MSEDLALTIMIYPMAGEPFAVTTTDFDTEDQAVEHIASALTSATPLRLTDHNDPEGNTTLVLNLANVIGVRVLSASATSQTGQYL